MQVREPGSICLNRARLSQAWRERLVVGYCSAVTPDGRRWIVDAHKGDGRGYIVESDELLTAFLELEATLL